MSHDQSPIEQALDLAFFGPLGFALAAKDALPGWVDKGRSRISHQVEVARMVGEHATRHGHKVMSDTLVGLGILPGPPPPPSPRPPGSSGRPEGDAPQFRPPAASANARSSPGSRAGRARVAGTAAAPDTAQLAIPGYDSLSASQVVQRLAGLAPSELEAVRSYEAGGRGRRTVLTRIAQLQSGRS